MTPVYLINLGSSTDRLATATAQLAKAGIAFERVPAFDGRGKALAEFSEYRAERTHRAIGRDLVGGEVGCYLSHLAVLRRFLESGKSSCVVLEDDLVISDDLAEAIAAILAELLRLGQDWDVVNIGARSWKLTTEVAKIRTSLSTYSVRWAHYYPMTTTGLIWSRSGAQRFLNTYDGIDAPIDEVLRRTMTRSNRGFSMYPVLVRAEDGKSDIASAAARSTFNRRWDYGIIKQTRLWRNKAIAMRNLIKVRYQHRR